MRTIGRKSPDCGFGGMFRKWVFDDDPKPYNSFSNGAAMRVSPCGFIAQSEDEAKLLARKVTEVTHNHPEGLKGAEATAVAVFLARNGTVKHEIKERMKKITMRSILVLAVPARVININKTCQGTVPQTITVFLESVSFEDAIRTAVNIGGDSDTLAAITGCIAEAYYDVSLDLKRTVPAYLGHELLDIYRE